MSRRSRKHKKRFSCGHRGFGRYCHCCADRARHKASRLTQRQEKRQQWITLFEQDEIDLSHLPRSIVTKARGILAQLATGTQYWQMAGKRLVGIRSLIRIPVTRRYRLLCRDQDGQIVPEQVVSHERYNYLSR